LKLINDQLKDLNLEAAALAAATPKPDAPTLAAVPSPEPQAPTEGVANA
jgi:hypothetical protein